MEGSYELPELDKMRHGVNYEFPVKIRSFTLTLRPLSNAELLSSYSAVTEYITMIPASKRTKLDEDNALAKIILEKAAIPYGEKTSKLNAALLQAMTTDEIMYLYTEWRSVCDRVNPLLEKIPQEVIKSTIEAIKKKPPTDLDSQLTELSFGQLVNLVRYLLTNDVLPTGNSSGGSSTQ